MKLKKRMYVSFLLILVMAAVVRIVAMAGTERSCKEEIESVTEELPVLKEESPVQQIQQAEIEEAEAPQEPLYAWTEENEYMLMKIAMAEMESESIESKALVIRIVLNRVESDSFPNTIKEVLYQKNQFTPIWNGRYDRVEPNEDCKEALEMVRYGWDESQGATFFELTSDESTWHSRNLQKLFELEHTTFYKEKE